jgi:glycosyltransferase involved in cell wall biosynthesis
MKPERANDPEPHAMKPRLCIVNPFEHGGGAEYQIELLVDALAASDRYRIHYLTHFVDPRDRVRNYEVARIGGGGGAVRWLGYLADARSLTRALDAIRPSLIYQRVGGAYTGICAHYARRHSIPLVWHVAHDTDVSPSTLDPARNVLRVGLEKWALNFGARNATRIIAQTAHQAALLQSHFGRTADAIIPNFHPPAAEIIDKSGPLTVLWVANLKSWKRPEVFVRLAQSLQDRPAVRFVMIGASEAAPGNPSRQEALMRAIESTPNLEYVGRRSHAEVNARLARAHIFVNTSTHEGFPNTFIQSWLRDAAVVSLSVDPDHVLEKERAGILAGSEPALAAAVRTLIDDPRLRESYVVRGRAHAVARHSLGNARTLTGLIESWTH